MIKKQAFHSQPSRHTIPLETIQPYWIDFPLHCVLLYLWNSRQLTNLVFRNKKGCSNILEKHDLLRNRSCNNNLNWIKKKKRVPQEHSYKFNPSQITGLLPSRTFPISFSPGIALKISVFCIIMKYHSKTVRKRTCCKNKVNSHIVNQPNPNPLILIQIKQ